MSYPPLAADTPEHRLAFLEGWSNARLGYPAPPAAPLLDRARNVSAILRTAAEGGLPVPPRYLDTISGPVRLAACFLAGQDAARAA